MNEARITAPSGAAGEGGAWALPGLLELQADCAGGDPEICVAVLDGSADLSHPCFAGARIEQLDADRETAGSGGSEHGTHVASVIFGQWGSPVRGIAPRCRGLVLPVYRQGEDGSLIACQQIDLARAIHRAVAAGAHVINISGGELTHAGEADPFLAEAIRSCTASGVLVVAATGNEGCSCLHVPAALPEVLAVGASDAQGRPLAFSNWGERLSRQGVLAPGEGVLGALPGGGTQALTGTSFAAPIVSGLAALLLSRQQQTARRIDPTAVREAILRAAVPCEPAGGEDCPRFLAGRLDIVRTRELLGLQEPNRNPFTTRLKKETNMGQETRGTTGPAAEPPSPGAVPAAAEPAGVSPSCACQGSGATASAVEPSGTEEESTAQIPVIGIPGVRSSAAGDGLPAPAEPAVRPSQVFCGGTRTDLVFALGELGYDFGCEARLDYFVQKLGDPAGAFDPVKMASHLDQNNGGYPEDANALIWTLNIDATPVYAIEPRDQFAVISYLRLAAFLVDQEKEGVERISVAGQLQGTRRLYNGTVVPVIHPVTRGFFNWNTERLVEAVVGPAKARGAEDQKEADGIRNFLQRIYYELRNLGVAPQDRAKNFAATNAFQLKEVYHDACGEGLQLDTIDVERSPICRPDSDCWDVKLTFFDPVKRFERARKVYRYTVDVSDVVPVTVGKLRTWYQY